MVRTLSGVLFFGRPDFPGAPVPTLWDGTSGPVLVVAKVSSDTPVGPDKVFYFTFVNVSLKKER